MKEQRFYRAKDLSVFLGIGLSTVWKWRKEGKITSIKLSKGVTVFDIYDVLKYLNNEEIDLKV